MRLSLLLLALFLGACGYPDSKVYADKRSQETRLQYMKDVFMENLRTTDLTVKVTITSVSVSEIQDDKSIFLKYDSIVLDTYQGTYGNTVLKFYRVAASGDESQYRSGDELIVSLCLDNDNRYYLPDIGFDFPASREFVGLIQDDTTGQRPEISLDNICSEPY